MSDAYPLLRRIVQPADLHRLSSKELTEVAQEVRQAILDKVSKTGGHFSSNLGTVELTVALYAAYEMPPDIVVWDTGHQAYPHKLLTGRLDQFDTLRRYKGISGFLRREEHPLDHFGAGHAGTAISAALGFASARDQLEQKHRVAAVTGDASIASGMSWEALNHAGAHGTAMAVVLNDNRMSIAPGVGALTSYFARLRSRPIVQDLAQRAKALIERIPGPAPRIAAGLRHGLTHYFAPEETGTVFEELGFEYLGPVDGHDLPAMLEIFRNARDIQGPVFVHAITVKGKGYQVSEDDARKWHAVVPFDLNACEMGGGGGGAVRYTDVFGATLASLAREDPKVVAITAAMPDGTGLNGFAKEFPDRTVDVGIAEQHAVTLAAGMAAGGVKPFCAIYSTFLQRAFDQVLHDVALQNLPVRFCLDRAGLVGDDGPTHHGAFDLSYLGLIPNMTVLAPRDTTELAEMLRWMAGWDGGPSAVRYPRGTGDDRLPESRAPIELGRAESLGVPGGLRAEVGVLAIGSMVGEAWAAAGVLAQEGIGVEVVNLRFAKPLDREAVVGLAGRVRSLVTVEENVGWGGIGQQVRSLATCPVVSLSLPDAYVEHGPQATLRADCGLCAEGIERAVRSLLGTRQRR